MSRNDYETIGPLAYRGKSGCTDVRCTWNPSYPETCYGWHCSYCDAACGMMGHKCDAADAVLNESRRVLDEGAA